LTHLQIWETDIAMTERVLLIDFPGAAKNSNIVTSNLSGHANTMQVGIIVRTALVFAAVLIKFGCGKTPPWTTFAAISKAESMVPQSQISWPLLIGSTIASTQFCLAFH